LAKTVTPSGSATAFSRGQPVPPLQIFRCGREVFAAQKPIAYTDLLDTVVLFEIVE